MESTTLEQAAESLLAPSEETSEENNLDEAVDVAQVVRQADALVEARRHGASP